MPGCKKGGYMALVRKSFEQMRKVKSRSDWAKVDKLIKNNIEVKSEGDFDGGRLVHIGPLVGRPRKAIRLDVVALRLPSPLKAKLKASGKGWSSRASNALASLIQEGKL